MKSSVDVKIVKVLFKSHWGINLCETVNTADDTLFFF